jgi:hypothetical protein
MLPLVAARLPRVSATIFVAFAAPSSTTPTLPASPPSISAWRWRYTFDSDCAPSALRISTRPPSSCGSVRLGRSWLVGGDVMLLDTWYAKGQTYNGKRVAGAPQFTAAARVSYDVPLGPGLGANAKYTDNTAVHPAGDLETGGYMLVNVGANYLARIGGHDVTLRAAIDNVTNRRYWAFQYDSYIAPGETRTVSLNAKIDF